MKNDNISSRQMIFLLVMFRVSMSLSYLFSIDVPPGNQDNWIIILLSFFYTMLFSVPFLILANRFKDFNMIEYFSIVLGKWVGKIVIIIYGLYFLMYIIYLIVLENQFVSVSLLPNIDNWIIISIMLIVSLYILSKGIIIIYWSGELISLASFLGLSALLILGLKNVDVKILLPILGDSTIKQINHGAFLSSLVFLDIFLLTMGAKFLEDRKKINKILLKSVIYSILIVAVTIAVIQTSVGVEQSRRSIYPLLLYTRLINYSSTVERIDILYTITWLTAHSGKIAVYLLFSLMCFKEAFNIKKDRWIVLVLAIIVGIASNFISSRIVFGIDEAILESVLFIPFIFTTIIPAVICIVYFFRKKTLTRYTI